MKKFKEIDKWERKCLLKFYIHFIIVKTGKLLYTTLIGVII